MRILMLAQSFAPVVGGEERVVEDQASELVGRGHHVAIATVEQPGVGQPGESHGARVHTLRTSRRRLRPLNRGSNRHHAPPLPDPDTVLDLRRVMAEEQPEVVHAHNWIVHSYLPLDRDSDAALVLSLHDYGLLCATKRLLRKGRPCSGPGAVQVPPLRRQPLRRHKGAGGHGGDDAGGPAIRRHVDLFLPVSSIVQRFCRLVGEESEVLPNFIRSLPEPVAGDPLLDRLPDEPFILYFGDVTEDKGAWDLVEAYRELRDPPPLVLIGRRYLDGLNDRPGVHALGSWPHDLAIEALRRSMFAIVPSIWAEPFGLVALEAAAAGKAVIASNIGGLIDIVVDERTGILVPPGDREALGGAIERLAGDAGASRAPRRRRNREGGGIQPRRARPAPRRGISSAPSRHVDSRSGH